MKVKYEWSPRNIVDRVKSGVSAILNPSTYGRELSFWTNGAAIEYQFTYSNAKSSLNAYNRCPPVAAIVNRKAQAYINGKPWVLNSKEKEADTPDARKVKNLLNKPNPIQSWKQFEAQGYIYQQLYGYNIILSVKPFGFKENIDATALWNITPFCQVRLKVLSSIYGVQSQADMIDAVYFDYGGKQTPLDLNDVFFMKDLAPSFYTLALPESRIVPLSLPINNVIGAYESRHVLINSRGPLYIVSSADKDGASGNVPLLPKEKEQLRRDFKNRYGLTRDQSTAIITNRAISVDSVGFATKDLLLMEEVQESCKAICDGLNYPAHLLGLIDPTFNNQNAAEKGLYQNSIIPDADNNYEQWDRFFGLYDRNLHLNKDFSHIAVLQEDKTEMGNARFRLNQALLIEWQNNILTWNQWQVQLGNDPTTGMDIYYRDAVALGWIFGSQGNIPKETPVNDPNNGTQQATAN
jgi:hypothetical protein